MLAEYFTDEKRLEYIDKLKSIIDCAPPLAYDDGKDWYRNAHNITEDIGAEYSVPGVVVRRVLSKISPRNPWEKNVTGTVALIRDGINATGVQCVWRHRESAVKMLNDWGLHLFTNAAPKTFHFFLNIDKYNEDTGVTVDRHAVKALGIPFEPNKKGPMSRMNKSQYYWISSVYSDVAKSMGLLPHEAQAIVWLCVRNDDYRNNTLDLGGGN